MLNTCAPLWLHAGYPSLHSIAPLWLHCARRRSAYLSAVVLRVHDAADKLAAIALPLRAQGENL